MENVTHNGEVFFLISGILSDLQVSHTAVNLLEKIEEHIRVKSIASGAIGILGGMHGIVASSTSLLLNHGEEAYNFAGVLDGEIVCGTFQHGDKLSNHDSVTAVVSRHGGALFVHSIMNRNSKEFYMPLNTFSSSNGMLRHCMEVALHFSLVGWIGTLAVFFISGIFTSSEIPLEKKLIASLMAILIPPLFSYPFEYWTYRSFRGEKDESGDTYASAIFRTWGFRKPNKIDLTRDSSISMGDESGWYGAWKADKLLAHSSQ